ncbi:hypothetical protein WJS89_12060 [Sphingomicrobium sp. XHP0235]|uniref:hypothetical protein n=1 Tax=Sphingomicrobium aquimarinum TaxID=3133971 RepID=UPI0031FEB4AC
MIPPARHRRTPRASLHSVFAIPLALLLATIVGLVSGLTGSGLRDVLAWVLLGVPLFALAVAWARRG